MARNSTWTVEESQRRFVRGRKSVLKGRLSKDDGQWAWRTMYTKWQRAKSSVSVPGKANGSSRRDFRKPRGQWCEEGGCLFSALVRIWPSADRYWRAVMLIFAFLEIPPWGPGWVVAGRECHAAGTRAKWAVIWKRTWGQAILSTSNKSNLLLNVITRRSERLNWF